MSKEKECPDCGVIMGYSDGVFACLDPDCGYVELEEQEETEDEDEEVYRCPHCKRIIEEEELP